MGAILLRGKYGWTRDQRDERDYRMAAPAKRLPKSIDLRAGFSAVKNQGTLGSCTGHGVGAYMEYLYPSRPNFSRLFIYYQGRALENTIEEDAGAQIRNVVKAMSKVGACRETFHPYHIESFAKKPSFGAYKDAARSKIGRYYRADSLTSLKTALADHNPVVFGFMVYDGFESAAVAETGKLMLPKANEECIGGHAVVAVGYDDRTKRVLVRNSWGRSWGMNGYFTMPYDYISNPDLADDFWVMKKA